MWAARLTALLLVGCGAPPTAPSVSPDAWKSPNLLMNRERIEAVKQGVARGDATLTAAREDLFVID
jgi:type IV pilus biogenesis protein CpaD/CtpE